MQQDNSTQDRGIRRGEEGPERLCAVTRRACDPELLLRFVSGPDGAVVPDLARKLPGRGIWLTATRSTVLQAVRQKIFARSFKREVIASDQLADLVGELMLKRVLEYLALANKAGLAVSGFAKVDRALDKGRIHALLQASDGAGDGIRKLDQKFVHVLREADVPETGRDRRTVRFLTIEELSLAIGRSNVVHAGLLVGGTSKTFLIEAERLLRYRLGVTALSAIG
jgi:uncharacterized protein